MHMIKTTPDELAVPLYEINALLGLADPCGLTKEQRRPLAEKVLRDFGRSIPMAQKKLELEYLCRQHFGKLETDRIVRTAAAAVDTAIQTPEEPERERDFRERQFKD